MAAAALIAAACGGGSESAIPTATEILATATPAATPSTGGDEPAERDLVDLARRLGGQVNPPRTVDLPVPSLGDEDEFDLIVLTSDADERPGRRTTTAVLRAISEHAYLYFEDNGIGDEEVADAVRAFEEEVWPTVTGAFGSPPSPGVDGDPRIAILYADLGSGLGGYVSGEDAYPREVSPHSNGREIVYLNESLGPAGSPGYTSTLAHELQHLIHRGLDAGEETWVNEGLSVFAAGLAGGGRGSVNAYLDHPDTQLNAWPDIGSSGASYGGSGLFFDYLIEQTGGTVGELAAETAEGVDGVRAFMAAAGEARTFEEFIADWAVANYLDEPEGPYGYRDVEVSAPETEGIDGPREAEGEIGQFAVDYLELEAEDFSGLQTFTFEGDREVAVIGAQASNEGGFWWSNRGDNIDSTLTRELDLTDALQATLTFRTWYDIERWFDFGYVAVSSDGGETWDVLAGEETTTDDPLEVAYGAGYNGRSGGGDEAVWVDERFDLSAYAGSTVLLRFELINDEGTNKQGWAIDDIAVPEIGFFDDGESDAGGWHREGFMRLTEPLSQQFALRLITLGGSSAVEEIELDGRNEALIALDGFGTAYSRAIIVIIGTTDGTTERASYRYEIGAPPPDIGP